MKRCRSISFLLTIAFATAASAAVGRFDVHLIEPAAHVDVAAGSMIPIAWTATHAPDRVEEWEAFVSIDGGRTYPIRITPHLDASIQRFAWTVPSLPGAELSILLRFGNEREETEFSFPARATVRGASLGILPREIGMFRRRRLDDHGEMLVAWVDGSRDGSDLKSMVVSSSRLIGETQWSEGRTRGSSPVIGSNASELDPEADVAIRCPDEVADSRPPGVLRIRPAGILALSRRLNV